MTNAYRFRPVEEWKSAILNLPLFFELMRSIFGNIKTPYNKQRLMDDLFILLSREDIRKIISSYIDREDHKIIAAAALLEDPPPEELEDFLLGDKDIVSVRGLLLNLEERLILFRFKDESRGIRRLALNPVLEPVLGQLAAETGILFPGENSDESQDANSGKLKVEEYPVSDDRVLGAFFAFVSAEDDFFKAEGIKKKVQEQGKKLFPGLDLEAAAGALKFLGLYYPEGEKFIAVNRKIRAFAELSPLERREYWAAGIFMYLIEKKEDETNSGRNAEFNKNQIPGGLRGFGLSRNQIHGLAGIIHKFSAFLDPQKQYPGITIRRLHKLLELENSRNYREPVEKNRTEIFINALVLAGILKNSVKENYWQYNPVKPADNKGPVIAMDSASTFVLYPGISFSEILKLSAFSGIKEDGPFNFELTRSSAVRGFNQGLDSQSMVKTLRQLSGNRLNEGLEWTLKDWEDRYASVLLHEGLVLCLSEERQYLAETDSVASLIQKKLAPGLYLLSGDSARAEAALQKAGVDIIARPARPQESGAYQGFGSAFPPLGNYENDNPVFKDESAASINSERAKSNTKDYFAEHLKKLKITEPEKNELMTRIERRIILTESQLDRAAVRHQKLEARGLDYTGKTSIVKQAIAEGSTLEVSVPDAETGIRILTGSPSALEKKGGESVLVLDNNTRIPLGKISLLRMIKRSIFNY